METINLTDYFYRIKKEETSDSEKLKYIFDNGKFECKVKVEKMDSRFVCLQMKVQTNYGYILDKKSRLVDVKAEDIEHIIKKFFIASILGIA